jgi:hypothetical protein
LETLTYGAWALVLSRYAATADVLFGVTLTEQDEEYASIVGLGAATVPFHVDVCESVSLWPWLLYLETNLRAVRRHRYAGLNDIRRWQGYEAPRPLFESAILYEHAYVEPSTIPWCNNLKLHDISAKRTITCPLTVVLEQGVNFSLTLNYATWSFDDQLITDLLGDMLSVFQQIVDDPYQTIGKVRLSHDAPLLKLAQGYPADGRGILIEKAA